jgi:chemotaxis signal transduction protein
MSDQYLTFSIRAEAYAVSILRVREIIEFEAVTPVPSTPAHIRGVIDLRGAVMPVIDLAVKFGGADCVPTRTTCIVIVETMLNEEPVTVGLIADAVSEVIELSEEQIEQVPVFGSGVQVSFLLGVARAVAFRRKDGKSPDSRQRNDSDCAEEKGLAMILDPDRILSPLELSEALAIGAAELPRPAETGEAANA